MATHTRNLCSAFDPSKVHTHSSEHTHTMNTHPEQWAAILCFCARGAVGGSGALLKGTSVVVLRVERALYIHSPHLQFLPARDSKSCNLSITSPTLLTQGWAINFPKGPHEKLGRLQRAMGVSMGEGGGANFLPGI